MKLFTGSVAAAALALSVAAAQAQLLTPGRIGSSPYIAVSDMDGPYAAMPEVPPPPRYGRLPSLLPPVEVYTVLRENGYLPLGAPRQRGFTYTIAVIDQGGADGRLVIDARDGRIIRFIPADRMGSNFDDDFAPAYGQAEPGQPMPPPIQARVPRPPMPIPHVARRAVPVPKRSPLAVAKSAGAPANAQAAMPEPAPTQAAAPPPPAQQPAAPAPKPAEAQAAAAAPPAEAAPTVGKVAPPSPAATAILPTQEMPKVQGLE
ncbi:hypothetical protein CI1B_21270 [Bradyrhizobium ivorense]|uniref:PepSY domain-containing protein n=1 Tax=Bradyrhizobium ivorense TaxID=2511166 RepID=A0A508T538_9BRAD|nr:hypothetical protein [Bradyrhizobium ivorense]VIO68507.1 hypothetical protein CI1B_21270 [Bradyrhizobium ivorense]